jgi:hypothetical protein
MARTSYHQFSNMVPISQTGADGPGNNKPSPESKDQLRRVFALGEWDPGVCEILRANNTETKAVCIHTS